MAEMSRNHEHILAGAFVDELSIIEPALAMFGVDHHLIVVILHLKQCVMGHTEAPVSIVIAGSVRDAVGLLRQCMDMVAQLRQTHSGPYRYTEVNDMEIVVVEIDNPPARIIGDERVTDQPFPGYLPIKSWSPLFIL